ncbi:MAG: hypothetical protein ABIF85_06210 [Nanoarchaeota archaeon]
MENKLKSAFGFLKKNAMLLVTESFDKDNFKGKKEKFKNDYKDSELDDKTIAEMAIKTYIKAGYFKTRENLETFLLDNDFFRQNIFSNEREIYGILWEEVNLKGFPEKFTLREVINILVIEEATVNATEKAIIVRSDTIVELDNKINTKNEMYNSIPSILDVKPNLPEPEEAQQIEYTTWWQTIGLRDDPFLGRDGLSTIPKEFYDKIMVQTEIIKKYHRILNTDINSIFFKSTVVFGEFGSGKTSFFEFLGKDMINHKIYPIYLLLRTEQDNFMLNHSFERKLFEILYELYEKERIHSSEFESSNQNINNIKSLMKILSHKGERNFVIFIDGLNLATNYDVVLSFLRDLQLYKNDLVRSGKDDGYKVGFFVAGAIEWMRLLTRDPSLTGSIEIKEEMPVVSPEYAYQMINNRFAAYSNNVENPKIIKMNFIKQVYRDLENNKQIISYRSFIQAIVENLKLGNLEIIENIKMNSQSLKNIKDIFESDPLLKKRMNLLIYSGHIQKAENRNICLRLLIKVFHEGYIKDDSDVVRNNDYCFQRLIYSNLVVKTKKDNELFWQICPEISAQNEKILNLHNRSLEDYLLPLYSDLTVRKQKNEENEDILKIEGLILQLQKEKNGQISRLIKDSSIAYKKIIELLDIVNDEIQQETLTDCWKSFDDLSRAFFLMEGVITENSINDNDVVFLWNHYWKNPEIISQYIKSHENIQITDGERRQTSNLYKATYNYLLENVEKHKNNWFLLPRDLSNLSFEEVELIFESCDLYRKGDPLSMRYIINKLSKKTQRVFRDFLFNVFTILYGSDTKKWFERLDNSTGNYIKQNLNKRNNSPLTPSPNVFNHLNRGNYKCFLTNDNQWAVKNWGDVFQYIFKGHTQKSFEDFLSIYFIEPLMSSEHDNENSVDNDYALRYINECIAFFKQINKAYSYLLHDGLYKDGTEYYFSFAGYKMEDGVLCNKYGVRDKKSLEPISSTDKTLIEYMKRLNQCIKNELQANNSNVFHLDLINGHLKYNIPYRTYVFCFSFLIQQKKLDPKDTPKWRITPILEYGGSTLLNFDLSNNN